MKYIKYFESFTEKIGDTITFIAKDKPYGYSYGSGFIVKKKDADGKWISNIDCKLGTEITGEIISLPKNGPLPEYKIKLPDGSFTSISLDFFDKKI